MSDDTGQVQELRRAAVMFPRLFLWIIGGLLSALTLLGGVVVAQVKSGMEENTKKVEKHETSVQDHEARMRLMERTQQDLKDKTTETNQDVKEIRRLIEEQMRHDRNAARRPPS